MRVAPAAMFLLVPLLLACDDGGADRVAAAEHRAKEAEERVAALQEQLKAEQAGAQRAREEAEAAKRETEDARAASMAVATSVRSPRRRVRIVDSGCKYHQVPLGDDYVTIKCLLENKGSRTEAASVKATMTRYRKPPVDRTETVALQPNETKEVALKFPEAGQGDEGLSCACKIVE